MERAAVDEKASPEGVRALLIDGHSLAFRAFFALPELKAGDGQETGALHGFLNMLRKLVADEQPTHVAVAFDRGRPAFRMDVLPEYKAQREKAPDALHSQVDVLRQLLPGLGVTVVEAPGFEGDDVLGTLARRVEAAGGHALLVSGDRDLLQLVDDHVEALFTRRGISDVVRWGPDQVVAEYGIAPARLPEWKALAGDSSDNLPGVPGIGGKTATALLAQVPSLEALLAGEGVDLKPRQRDLLAEHREACLVQRDVATIRTDVPLDVALDGLAFAPDVSAGARAILDGLEMKGILSRWPRTGAGPAAARGARTDADGTADPAPAIATGPAAEPAAGAAEVGVWAHVDGTPGRRALRALAVWSSDGTFTSAGDGDAGVEPGSVPDPVWRLLADPGRVKAGFGLKEMYGLAREAGREVHGPLLDLALVAYLLEAGRTAYTPAFVAARLGGERSGWPEALEARAAAAAALAPAARVALARDGMDALYDEIEGPLMPVLADMEEVGVAVDRGALERLGVEFSGRIAELEGQIHELAKGPFNLNSPKQLADVLFGRLGLPVIRKTKTGPSTDADVLAELAPMHPIVDRVLVYRQLSKLRSTYVEGLVPMIGPDGRVHTTYNQTVAATGRLSSVDPNLQNIPVRLEEGRRVRSAFVAGPGMVLVGADYSQVELRVLAHLSGDEALVRAFAGGSDVHRETAAAVFGVTPGDVTSDMRRRAKAVNFGIVYGISAFGLSRDLGIAVDAAQAFIDTYFERYPRVHAFLEDTVAEARDRGYTLTPDGRRRYLPDLTSGKRPMRSFAERAAKNSPIQGMAADIIKRAMVALPAARLPGRLLLQVHDELIFEVPAGQAADLGVRARAVLEGAMQLSVPLTVDLKVGPSWAAAIPFDPADAGSEPAAVGHA